MGSLPDEDEALFTKGPTLLFELEGLKLYCCSPCIFETPAIEFVSTGEELSQECVVRDERSVKFSMEDEQSTLPLGELLAVGFSEVWCGSIANRLANGISSALVDRCEVEMLFEQLIKQEPLCICSEDLLRSEVLSLLLLLLMDSKGCLSLLFCCFSTSLVLKSCLAKPDWFKPVTELLLGSSATLSVEQPMPHAASKQSF